MAEPNKQLDRVVALANRLRLLQVDFADQTDEVRREYLTEEVRRVLATVPPNERKAFLDQLQSHFPTWDAKVEIQTRHTVSASVTDQKELRDPSFLVIRLIEVCKSLNEEQRRAVMDMLAQAGLSHAAGPGPDFPPADLQEVRSKLQLGPRDEINAGRALQLLAQMGEFVLSLNQVAWRTWRTMAPNSLFRQANALPGTLGRFAAGDPAVGRDQVINEMRSLRQLTAALIGTLSQTGRVALQHFRGISPEEIMLLVGNKGFGREAAYWRRYVELAGAMDAGGVEDAMRAALAEYVEALIKGAR